MGGISFNPLPTTTAEGSFNVDTVGVIQGTFFDDPAVRFELAGGIVDPAASQPFWGGMAITERIVPLGAAPQPNSVLGNALDLATAIGGSLPITGFTVFNQGHAMLNFPQSPVPQAAPGMSINFFRLGSNARIAVACDPNLASLIESDPINSQVSWDFGGQRLIPYVAAYEQETIDDISYVADTGVATLTLAGSPSLAEGDDFFLSGITGIPGLNGAWTAAAGTSGDTLVFNAPPNLPGSDPTGGILEAGGGAVPCRVLEFDIGNSMTVSYNAATGYLTWDRSGSCAVILI
jgi:hypothetical protein